MKRRPDTSTILDWEELEQAPNTHGAFSFLRSQNAVINIQEHRPRDIAQLDGELATQDKTYTVDETSPVRASSAPDGELPQREKGSARPYKIHRCYRAQDAHSPGENQLYGVLWHTGVSDGPETKRITMGHIRLAQAANLSDKAVKRCLAQLIKKLAIEVIAGEVSASRTGRTYRIHSFKSILERRNVADLQFVVRDKGVRFVPGPTKGNFDSGSVQALPTPDITPTVDISSPVTGDKTTPVTADKTSMATVDKTSPPLGSSSEKKERRTTTTPEDLVLVVAALSSYAVADEDAAEKIVSGTRAICESASIEEIVSVIHLKALSIVRDRSIHNPLGLMVKAVPQCFKGSGIRQLREQWAAEKRRQVLWEEERERQRLEMAEWVHRERTRCEGTLADESSTEKQKADATVHLSHLAGFGGR